MMVRLILIIFMCLFSCHAACAGISKADAVSLFVEGNLAYRDGRYTEAVKDYEKIIKGGLESGNIYFNLGNSYLKMNEVGKAILYYARAQKLILRDSDLKANYRLALSEMKGAPAQAGMNFWQKLILPLQTFLTLNEMLAILGILILLIGVYHLLSLYFKLPLRISIAFYLSTGLMVSWIIVTVIAGLVLGHNQAVMIADTDAKFEPRQEATTYFELYQGHKIRIIKPEGLWVKIERPDGKKGWVQREALERI